MIKTSFCLSLCFCCLSIMAAEREIKVRGTAFADMASAVDVLGQQAGIDFVYEKNNDRWNLRSHSIFRQPTDKRPRPTSPTYCLKD